MAAGSTDTVFKAALFVFGWGVFNLCMVAPFTFMIVFAVLCGGKVECTGHRPHFVVAWVLLTQVWSLATGVAINALTRRRRRGSAAVLPKTVAARVGGAALDRAFWNWIEYDEESVYAVLHSSIGVWLSPHYPVLGIAMCLLNIVTLPFFAQFFSAFYCAMGALCGLGLAANLWISRTRGASLRRLLLSYACALPCCGPAR